MGELSDKAKVRLAEAGGEREGAAMLRVIFEHLKNYSPADMVMRRDEEVTLWLKASVEEIVDRVCAGEPLQYVIGEARFMGNDFKVTPATLIPRPETAGLVDMIVDRYGGATDVDVLDACTGSGCIAVMLARSLKFPKVKAMDNSAAALEVARENARRMKVKVDFFEANALDMPGDDAELYDVIAANPPYVLRSEAADMDSRVLDYEPEEALFVSDDDPLKFYASLAAYGLHALKPSGRIYFEINPLESKALRSAMERMGYDVSIERDYVGKERYAILQKR